MTYQWKKTKFIRSVFGRFYGATICLRFHLTFTYYLLPYLFLLVWKTKEFFSGVFSVWNSILSAKGQTSSILKRWIWAHPWLLRTFNFSLISAYDSYLMGKMRWFEAIFKTFGRAIFEVIEVKGCCRLNLEIEIKLKPNIINRQVWATVTQISRLDQAAGIWI